MRRDYDEFVWRDAEILAIGPDYPEVFTAYWHDEAMPFVGLPDPDHLVSDLYGQEVRLRQFGRMPALVVIDKRGAIRYSHYGDSMRDIPSTRQVLAVLDVLEPPGQ